MINRVWLISELYYPEETSTGYFVTKIAEGLADHFNVAVLCSQPTYSARGSRAPAREARNRVDVQRCPSTTLNKNVLLFRIINLASITISISISLLFRIGKSDAVIVVTNPPTLPMFIALVCWLRRATPLLLVHDVYPEVLVAAGMIPADSIWSRMVGCFVKLLYRRMSRIIVLGRDMEKLILNRMTGDEKVQTAIIPNWADLEYVRPSDRTANPLLSQLGLTPKFVVLYSGNMGRTHGLDVLLAAAINLQRYKEIHFLFIGDGAKKEWLEQTVKKKAISNVTVLPPRPRSELAYSLTACDAALISFVPGMAGVSVPSRMYNALAAGKPIIAVADTESELARVVNEENVGWVVPSGDNQKLEEVILEALANPERLRQMGARARQLAETKYSFQQVIGAYYGLINGLN